LQTQSKISIQAYVKQIQYIEAVVDPNKVKFSEIERNMVRCPDQQAAKKMIKLITEMKTEGDSVGGVIECVIKNVPPGLGEPVFDRLEAELAKAMLSIPATKGFEIGSGFKSVTMKGSEHNDPFIIKGGEIHTRTNNSGGGQGGISNGENIVFRIIFKPAATIFKKQKTVTKNKKEITLEMKGRHDPCVLPRAVPVVEAMAALVLVDFWLRQRIR
jgi:chorismate synthase